VGGKYLRALLLGLFEPKLIAKCCRVGSQFYGRDLSQLGMSGISARTGGADCT
jgi:hypothetical protein